MPITYERDDERRLITVTAAEPYSVLDIISAIDRQAAEDTWGYAMLYDLRAATHMATDAEAQQMADRVKVVGAGRQRGPVGIAMSRTPVQFLRGLRYSELTRKIATIEVLLTAAQLDDWLARNAKRHRT
jgi:hypothetical protein